MPKFTYTVPEKKLYPAPEEFNRIVAEAMDDDAPDPRKLYWLAERAIRTNTRLKGYLRVRRTALAAFDVQVLATDPNQQELANEAALRCADAFNRVINSVTRVAVFASNIYKLDRIYDEKNKIATVRASTPAQYTQLIVDRTDTDVVRYYSTDDRLTLLNEFRSGLQFTKDNDAYLVESDSESGTGDAEAIVRLEIMRYYALNDWANLNALLKGLIHAKDRGASDGEVSVVKAALASGRGGGLLTSDMIDVAVSKLTDGSGGNSIEAFVKYIDSSLAIAILGQANTSELPSSGGSRAGLQVQRAVSADIMYTDMIRVEKLCNNILLQDYWWNHDTAMNAKACPWKFSFKIEQENNPLTNAEVLQTVLTAGLSVKADEAYSRVGFTRPDGVPDIIAAQPLLV